ncbi:hypothetical protein E8E15_002567 [Penicillium rubens]|nr:uncharacterized protein N7525_005087 [Penicillium rubens]KAF3011426.1 hypothetical protein E8E15_002567 [Penicillium rubens]KAJ5839899.1 hypothetical protein N7525_005087 [Penicillium rubens]KAJ5867890.1 hypothetical protein N7534_002443 [Penicillium rubens]
MFYEDVLPPTPKYEFKGVQDCLQILDQEVEKYEGNRYSSNPYIIFIVDERTFFDCFENPKQREKLLATSVKAYEPSTNHLLLEMESPAHAAARRAFERIFDRWIGVVSCEIRADGSPMNYRGPGGKNKKPDSAFTPIRSILNRHWPTVVLEVRYAETRSDLENDVKFWLIQAAQNVNVVISVEIFEPAGRVSMKQWKMGEATKRPFPCQQMEFVRKPAPKTEQVTGSLRVPFEDVYLRPKKDGETDWVVTASDLDFIAEMGFDELISCVAAVNPRTVVVLNNADPVLMPWLDQVSSVLWMGNPGQEGGRATAALLFGDHNPEGRLPLTYPSSVDATVTRNPAYPERMNTETGTALFSEGMNSAYRWYLSTNTSILFPFGFGKSYTRFEYKNLRIERDRGSSFKVSVDITNTGSRTGVDVPSPHRTSSRCKLRIPRGAVCCFDPCRI